MSTSFWQGLLFSRYQRPNLDFDIVTGSMARAARDFFKDFYVLAPEISKKAGPQGPGRVEGGAWPGARAIVGTIV